MKNAIRDHAEISHYAGKHPRFVQGGGGNCSVKWEGKIVIKASGFFLEEVSESDGYAVVDIETNKNFGENNLKPSMEVELHKLLSPYVIHTHPMSVAALVCAKQGKELFRRLFPESFCNWVDYAAPGCDLFLKVKSEVAYKPIAIHHDQVLFLANHGLFVASDEKDRCVELHNQVVNRLESFLGKELISDAHIPINSYLTPDHVVYCRFQSKTQAEKQKIATREVEMLVSYALKSIRSKNMEPAFLSHKDVDFISNMAEEKYRQWVCRENT